MSLVLIPPVLLVLALLVTVAYGTFNQYRQVPIGCLAIGVSLFAMLGAWHAWGESRSVLWTLIYGVQAVVGLIAATRNLTLLPSEPKDRVEDR